MDRHSIARHPTIDAPLVGHSPNDIVQGNPSLALDDVYAALAYAADITGEQLVALP